MRRDPCRDARARARRRRGARARHLAGRRPGRRRGRCAARSRLTRHPAEEEARRSSETRREMTREMTTSSDSLWEQGLSRVAGMQRERTRRTFIERGAGRSERRCSAPDNCDLRGCSTFCKYMTCTCSCTHAHVVHCTCACTCTCTCTCPQKHPARQAEARRKGESFDEYKSAHDTIKSCCFAKVP